ncbi:hypothetical protein II582_03830 [bacterium]|nr:hypothetical protein [bacterium]
MYGSIVVLAYFYFSLLNRISRNELKQTDIIREVSIAQAE